jgi:hypothetical protein
VLAPQPERCLLRPFDWALTQRVLGMAAAAAGLWDEAERHFETALEQALHAPVLLDVGRTRHRYGEALLRHGGAAGAARGRELLEQAVADHRRLGMPLLAEEAERLLASAAAAR